MKLWYGDIGLHDLGELQILGQSSGMEPPDAPQRERRTLRVKLNFWEQSYTDNATQVEAVRAALTSQQANLQWQENAGGNLINRTVTVSESTQPEVENAQGTYRQSIVFSFWFYNHNLKTNCLPCTITAFTASTGGTARGGAVTLGTVEKWSEGFVAELFDPVKDARKLLMGQLAASGHFLGDTTADLATRRNALLAAKDAMIAEYKKGVSMAVAYGTFDSVVRITGFKAEVNQPMNAIEWSFTATYLAYPGDAIYYWLEYSAETKLNETTGITTFILSGRIGASDEATARARLADLIDPSTGIVPAPNSPINNTASVKQVESRSGTANPEASFSELTFTLEFYITTGNAALIGNVLNVTPLDMGFVYEWSEGLDTELFDPMKDARKRLTGSVAAKGRYTGNMALEPAARQTALLALKDAMIAEITKGASMNFAYASFNQTVRITSFKAMVNQSDNVIEWQLAATYTAYPDEANYFWLDYTITTRTTASEGITFITLNGRMGATTQAVAATRLTQLYTGANPIIPAGYVNVNSSIVPRQVESKGGTNVIEAAFTELMFTLEFRDTTTLPLTYRQGGTGPSLSLGTVEKFADRYDASLFDEMKADRKMAMGNLTITGRIYEPDTLTLAAKRSDLAAQKAALDAAFNGGSSGLLAYGAIFSNTIRVIDWDCQVNRLFNCLDWSLTANYVRFPDPNNYAICDFNLTPNQNKLDGTVTYSLTGRIGSNSVEAAYAKLATLRTLLIPTGFAQTGDAPVERRVQVQSGSSNPDATFIELTFNDEWRKTTGNILQWDVKITNADTASADVKTGFTRVVYSGTVTATGASLDAAFDTAEAQARTLGDGKLPFKIAENITATEKLFQTDGGVFFVPVDFSFEYQVKGNTTYLEMVAERTVDTFGQTVETVNGYVAAPDLATAAAAYQNNVRGLDAYKNLLILSERTPTLAQQQLGDQTQFDRYVFSFSVLISKGAAETAMEYSIEPNSNLLTLEKNTTVRGVIYALDAATANTFLDNFLSNLSLGQKVSSSRPERHRKGASVLSQDTKVDVFVGLEFNEVFMDRLTGLSGILECEVAVALQNSSTRWTSKPVPDGPDIIQNCGHKPGRRTVSGTVSATTDTACLVWAKKQRVALLTGSTIADGGPYEEEPNITTRMRFAPRVDGTVDGSGANVRIYEMQFSFAELLPQMPFTP